MNVKILVDKVANVLKSIESIKNDRVLVGIPQEENKRDDGAMTNSTIGYIQENGSPARNIPARPFLVPGVNKIKDEAAKMLADGARDALNDGDTKKALTKVGILASSSVKKTLQAGEGFKPLSDVTVELRRAKKLGDTINGARVGEAYKASQSAFFVKASQGEFKPLIDTGQLRNSITYVIRSK